MSNNFEIPPEEVACDQKPENVARSEAAPGLLHEIRLGLDEGTSLPPEIKAILHELDELGIPCKRVPMADMWRGNPVLWRVESNEDDKDVSVEVATGVDDTARRLRQLVESWSNKGGCEDPPL